MTTVAVMQTKYVALPSLLLIKNFVQRIKKKKEIAIKTLKMTITFGIIHAASFTVKSSETLRGDKINLERLKITIINRDTTRRQKISSLFHVEYNTHHEDKLSSKS